MQRKWMLLHKLAPPHLGGIVALALLTAAVLRIWGLPGIPPGPHYDEAANGILAAEIANGEKTPLFIPAYTGKEVLFFYGAAATMRLLGVGVLALRLTAAFFGLVTVVATLWLVYELFADDDALAAPVLAGLTTVLIATSFWHVLLSRVGFRAIAQPLLQTLTLAALWRGLRHGDRRAVISAPAGVATSSPRSWLLLGGFFCGLSGYTYLAARVFPIPLAVALLAWVSADPRRRRERLAHIAVFGLAALVSFAPLGLYFIGHPDAFTTRISQVGPGNDWDAAFGGIVSAFEMLFLRGDPYIRFNLPHRPLFDPVMALFFVVGLAATVWRFFRPARKDESCALARARETLLLVWIPVMLLPSALAVNEITPSNLRAVGLVPLVFVFPARGIWTLLILGQHRPRVMSYLAFSAISLLLLATAVSTARAYFGQYAPRTDLYEASDGDLADMAQYLNQSDLTDTTVYVGSIHYRHPTLAFMARAYSQIKWLVGASSAVYPASGQALYLFPRSATPTADWLARYLPGSTPIDAAAGTDGAPAFTAYHLTSPPLFSNDAVADFSGIVRVLRHQVERASSGSGVDVVVVWQVLASPPYSDLTPFYHLVDLWGTLWGQVGPFQYAAEDWTPGEIVVNQVHVPIAPGAPPGDYLLKLGLYSQSADARLAVVDAADRFVGTTVPLTVTVARAETPPDLSVLEMRRRLDLATSDGLKLLGANLDTVQARPGERVHLTLFWQTNQAGLGSATIQRADYAVGLLLRDAEESDVTLYRGAPVHGTYPTSQWTTNEIVVDRYNPRLPLAAAQAQPGEYSLALTLTAPEGDTVLGPLVLGTVSLNAADRTFEVPAIRHKQSVTLSNQAELLGYDLGLANAHAGGIVKLTLYWRALAEMDTSYTVFTHLLGPDGQIVAQQDNPPVHGTYPTTLWLPGEVVSDPYEIALPDDLASGEYPVEIGFYVAENGLRLSDPILLNTAVTVRP